VRISRLFFGQRIFLAAVFLRALAAPPVFFFFLAMRPPPKGRAIIAAARKTVNDDTAPDSAPLFAKPCANSPRLDDSNTVRPSGVAATTAALLRPAPPEPLAR